VKLRLSISLLTFFLCLFFSPSVLAAGFQLKSVGGLNTEGATLSHLWYSNSSVTFTGTALGNATVTATIDGTTNTATADASGNWSYSTTLAEGDHQISFSSDGSTISFTLTIGQPPADIGSLPTATTPTAGNATPTIIFLSSGGLLILSFLFLSRKRILRS